MGGILGQAMLREPAKGTSRTLAKKTTASFEIVENPKCFTGIFLNTNTKTTVIMRRPDIRSVVGQMVVAALRKGEHERSRCGLQA